MRFTKILALLVLLWSSNLFAGEMTLEVLDVGQGDAILIQVAGKTVLVDGAEKKANVVDQLRARGVERIDMVVATHPHSDHISGLRTVVDEFEIGLYIDNGYVHTSSTYEQLMEAIESKGIKYKAVIDGQTFKLGSEARLSVLAPPETFFSGSRSDVNANTVIMRLDHDDVCVMLTGDTEAETESYLVEQGLEPCELLKAPHHGSDHSSQPAFLDALQPEAVLISCGENNRYGHPGAETMARYAERDLKVYRTDTMGSLKVISDGKGYSIETEREPVELHSSPAGGVPAKSGLMASPALRTAEGTQGGGIDINTAGLSELTSLPGIGKGKAQKIIDYREANGPFKSVDELTKVKGIGANTLDKFRDQVSVGGEVAKTHDSPGEDKAPAEAAASTRDDSGKLNINTASVSQLTALKGIGKGKAQKIVDYREANGPFKTVDELTKVKGIGAKTVDKFRDQVSTGGGKTDGAPTKAPSPSPTTQGSSSSTSSSAAGAIDINTASVSQLTSLKGIGKGKAQKIVDYREANGPFKSVDELTKVKGIGAKTVDKFRDQVSVGGGGAAATDLGADSATPKEVSAPSGDGVNVNSASVSELTKLPGIGKGKAQKIIDYREANGPFASCDALTSVKGIGPKTVAKFSHLCRVE